MSLGNCIFPKDLEYLPCPTVATPIHLFKSSIIRHICELFDIIVPVSKAFIPHMKTFTDKPVLDIPFGACWGSFSDVIEPNFDNKDVDVSIILNKNMYPVYGDLRDKTIESIKAFKDKYRDQYNVVISGPLNKIDFFNLLRRSRISLNIAGIHGPYNYRTCEIMNAGTLLFQMNNSDYFIPSDITDYFDDGVHFVSFNSNNLEERLLYYLNHKEKASTIAKQGLEYLEEKYSIDKIYQDLFTQVANTKIQKPFKNPDANYHLGQAYWCFYYYRDDTQLQALSWTSLLRKSSLLERTNNYIAMLPKLIQWLSLNFISNIIQIVDPLLVSIITRQGISNAIKYLYQRFSNHPVILWNYVVFYLENNEASPEFIEKAITNFENEPFDFDPSKLIFNIGIQPSYLSDDYYFDLMYGFEQRLLKYNFDKKLVMQLYRDYAL